jgi:hypothetical protein
VGRVIEGGGPCEYRRGINYILNLTESFDEFKEKVTYPQSLYHFVTKGYGRNMSGDGRSHSVQ